MKILLLILISFHCQAQLTLDMEIPQSEKLPSCLFQQIEIGADNMNFRSLLGEIEQYTISSCQISFVYAPDRLPDIKISFEKKYRTIFEILTLITSGTPVSFIVKNNHILII